MKALFPLALVVIVFGLAGCLTDKGELVEGAPEGYCDSLQATYVSTMKTLIDTRCATQGCHSAQSSLGDFTTYATMQSFGVLEQSQIGARVASGSMPPGNPLPDSLKQVFECWVSNGFPQQ